MSTFIYIPKPYTITGQAELAETLASPLTYRSAITNGTVTPSVSGYMAAYGEGVATLADSISSSVKGKLNAFVTDSIKSTASLSGRVIHFAPCTQYSFPGLAKESWTPDVFNEDVTYHNNISGTGQFIGRSVIRKSRSVNVSPISFNAPVSKMSEIRTMLNAMEKAPFYVRVCAPYSDYVIYGWIEKTPQVQYSADYGQVTISFSMRTTA